MLENFVVGVAASVFTVWILAISRRVHPHSKRLGVAIWSGSKFEIEADVEMFHSLSRKRKMGFGLFMVICAVVLSWNALTMDSAPYAVHMCGGLLVLLVIVNMVWRGGQWGARKLRI